MVAGNTQDYTIPTHTHVRFVEYTGDYPNLCTGKLTLNIDGEDVTFGYPWTSNPPPTYRSFWRSGGGLLDDYEGTYDGEWIIDTDELPKKYRQYASEIDRVFNDNVEYGCCGGCI